MEKKFCLIGFALLLVKDNIITYSHVVINNIIIFAPSPKCRQFVRKKRRLRVGGAPAIPAPSPARRTRTIPTVARPVRPITIRRPPIGYRAFSAGASSRRSSIGHAPRINSATSCGSTGTGVNTAGSASASASAWVEMVSTIFIFLS